MDAKQVAEWRRLAEMAMHGLLSSGKPASEATAAEAYNMAELMLAEQQRRRARHPKPESHGALDALEGGQP